MSFCLFDNLVPSEFNIKGKCPYIGGVQLNAL